jgi:hypothetical protein
MTILGGGSTITTLHGLHVLKASTTSQESQEFGLGSHTTTIMSPSGCFGSVAIDSERTRDNLVFSLSGWLSLSYQNAPYNVSLKGTISFNSLKQLNSSIVEINLPDSLVTLGTIGVNPIRFGTAYVANGKGHAHTIPLPGPVTLEVKSPGRYSVRHADITNISFTKFTPLLKSFYSSSISFETAKKGSCSPEAAHPYKIDTVVDTLLAISRLLPKFEGSI